MSAVLEVHDLEKSFGAVVAAHDINVVVEEGETIGVIGANGAGKTTFVNLVTGHLPPGGGTVEFMGRSILGLSVRAIARMGLCRSFQVPQVFLSETAFDNLMMAYGVAEQDGAGLLTPLMQEERAARVEDHLARYQISEYRDVIGSALPQGIRKLLDIAMATVRKPRLLMLDEPTSGISAEEKFAIMDILMQALREERTTVLFIEHDMEIVERYVARVLAFYQGEIICDAPTAQALRDDGVREYVLGQGQAARAEAPAATAQGSSTGDDTLAVSGLDVSIGATQILRGVHLSVPAGSMCGLIGRNGAGKTTFMRAVMGALSLQRGRVQLAGDIDLTATPAHRRAHLGIGFMPEDRRLVPELTAEENILLPVWATGAENARERLRWIYGLMPEVEEFRHRGATSLSGGQQKFVAFARALMCGTRLLLLDEPGEGIAPIFAQRMVEILDDLKKEGASVLVAESNDVHIARLLDRTFVIERGSIVDGG